MNFLDSAATENESTTIQTFALWTEDSEHRLLASNTQKGFGALLIILLILALFYGIYLCYKRWKKIQDFQAMEETRAHTSELVDMGDSRHGEDEIERDERGDELL